MVRWRHQRPKPGASTSGKAAEQLSACQGVLLLGGFSI
jgi:hypothetical protein